jgi:hypothetical protein
LAESIEERAQEILASDPPATTFPAGCDVASSAGTLDCFGVDVQEHGRFSGRQHAGDARGHRGVKVQKLSHAKIGS